MSTDTTLQQWLDLEAQVIERVAQGPGPGVARPDQVAGRSGLELMQAMLDGEIPDFGDFLEMRRHLMATRIKTYFEGL